MIRKMTRQKDRGLGTKTRDRKGKSNDSPKIPDKGGGTQAMV